MGHSSERVSARWEFGFEAFSKEGQGLYLDVQPSGSRGWIQRLVIRGRRSELGLGGFPLVSLKEAHEKAFVNRKLAREGGDPLSEKHRVESTPTFAEAARQVWKQLRPGWRSREHAQLWLSSLERYAIPRIGKMPISEVTSADVIGILAPIWHDTAATARKLRQRIRAVMEWAVAMDLRPDNPCDRIGPVLGSQGIWCGTCGRCLSGKCRRRPRRCGDRTHGQS